MSLRCARLIHRMSVALLLLPLTGCGSEGTDSSPGDSVSAAANDSQTAASSLQAWDGLWIDDHEVHLHITKDGRYAKFGVSEAASDLRYSECGTNEYGERSLPALVKKAGWEVEGDKLVSYKRPADPARSHQRIVGRTFRRLNPEERLAYWEASSFRLVRLGLLDEIREAEKAGFDFSKVVDSSITQAEPGQNVFVDMVAYAQKCKQPEVAQHFLDQGFVTSSEK